jgi:hypothetical protein
MAISEENEINEIKEIVVRLKDVKYGLIDKWIFERIKPNKNNVYANSALITARNEKFEDFITFAGKFLKNSQSEKIAIMFQPADYEYNWVLVKKIENLTPEKIQKYLLLI